MLFNSKAKMESSTSTDKYSYFFTSPVDGVSRFIEKLHLCSWLFQDGDEYLECGVQLRLMNDELDDSNRKISILFWLPWIHAIEHTEGADGFEDLYPALKETENARFIFNEGVSRSENFDMGERKNGVLLFFNSGLRLAVLPVCHEFENGRIKLTVHVPDQQEESNEAQEDTIKHIYFRFLLKVPESYYSFRQKAISKTICSYDVKINEPRNHPEGADFNKVRMCPIGSAYVLHIIPGNYNLTFLESSAFKSVRILEKHQYENYVKEIALLPKTIAKDKHIVVFNKKKVSISLSDDKTELPLEEIQFSPCSFFSVFEVETIGYAQVVLAIILNFISSLLFYFITCIDMEGKYQRPSCLALSAIGCITIGLGVCSWFLVRRQVKFITFLLCFIGVALFVLIFTYTLQLLAVQPIRG